MNRENIQKVRDHIASLPPAKFDMGSLGSDECGSPACIAGWTPRALGVPRPRGVGPMAHARRLLGLTEDQADELFMPSEVPFGDVYDATPAQGAKALDILLERSAVDWKAALSDEEPPAEAAPVKTPRKSRKDGTALQTTEPGQ